MTKKRTGPSDAKKAATSPRRSVEAARQQAASEKAITPAAQTDALARDIRQLIDETRRQVVHAANEALTTLHWRIGTRIRQDVLREQRAEYGAEIVSALGRQLESRYGRGFGEKSLRHMVRFAEAFPEFEIVSALRRQLSWTHFKQLIYLDDPLKRDFYAEMCRVEHWTTRVLRQKIDGMLYEAARIIAQPDLRRE